MTKRRSTPIHPHAQPMAYWETRDTAMPETGDGEWIDNLELDPLWELKQRLRRTGYQFPDDAPPCYIDYCGRPAMFGPVCIIHAIHISESLQQFWGELRSTQRPRPADRDRYRPAPRAAAPDNWVYYLMVGPSTVKIGTTANLPERLRGLRADPQYVVAIEPGDSVTERERHQQFAAERIGRREDFQLTDSLKTHIDTLLPTRDRHIATAMTTARQPTRRSAAGQRTDQIRQAFRAPKP